MAARYRVGAFELDPGARQLSSQGRIVPIGSRAFDLLAILVENRGRVLAKQELMDRVWPDVAVEENNLTVQVSALRKVLGHGCLATVAGRGYQLTLPVQVLDVTDEVAGGHAPLSLPDKPSIVVLPFCCLSPGTEDEAFVDGITEDITTELSRFHFLFVIARSSACTYQPDALDVRAVTRDLGVRYALAGSVRLDKTRVRVSAQLIDGPQGVQIWAERYDREPAQIFDVQQQVTEAIVASIAPQIEVSFANRPRPGTLAARTAYGLGMRAWLAAQEAFGISDQAHRDQALQTARDALAIDPDCIPALRAVAHAHWYSLYLGTAADPEAAMREAMAAANHAISVDSAEHGGHIIKGMLLFGAGEHEAAMINLRRAYELNPNDVLILAALGFYEAMLGNAQQGIDYTTRALRLSPRDPRRVVMLNAHAWSCFAAEDLAGALDASQRAIAEAPELPSAHLCRTLCLAGLGCVADARAAYERLNALAPELARSRLAGQWVSPNPEYRRRASAWMRIVAGAGPEHDA